MSMGAIVRGVRGGAGGVDAGLEGVDFPGQRRIGCVGHLSLAIGAGCTGGKQHQRIGCRGIAIDGDGIESRTGAFRQQNLQRLRRDIGICHDEGQHRRHVGSDHAGTLGDTVDDDRNATTTGCVLPRAISSIVLWSVDKVSRERQGASAIG